jgi:hypothetical protein
MSSDENSSFYWLQFEYLHHPTTATVLLDLNTERDQ